MRLPPIAASVLLVVGLAACGSDDSDGSGDAPDTTITDLELDPIDDEPDVTLDEDGEEEGDDDAVTKPSVEIPDSLPTELVITDLETGTGHAAEPGDSVVVDYVGVRSEDGTEFDSSYDRGTPFNIRLGEGRVIAGWDEGLVGVQTGGRRQLDIPAELAYGDNPQGGSAIQPGDALTFVVDVRAVVPSVDPEDAPALDDVEPSVGRSDLGIDDLLVGDGPELEDDQTAIAHLVLLRGEDLEVLESTWELDDPAQIILGEGNAIQGLVEGLAGMRVGGIRVISIPPDLAFGEEGIPEAGVPGDADVIIVVELVGLY